MILYRPHNLPQNLLRREEDFPDERACKGANPGDDLVHNDTLYTTMNSTAAPVNQASKRARPFVTAKLAEEHL